MSNFIGKLHRYNEPPSIKTQQDLASKLPVFWQLKDTLEMIFIGNSRMRRGIDPRYISNKKCYNMGCDGGDLKQSFELINNYVLLHCPNIKFISICLFTELLNEKDGNRTWKLGTQNTIGYNYDRIHNFWTNGFPVNFFKFMMIADNPADNTTHNGYYEVSSRGWGSTIPTVDYIDWGIDNENYINNFNQIKLLAQTLADKNIHLLIIEFPFSPHFKNTTHYCLYGPSMSTAHSIIDQFKLFCNQSSFTHFYDANNFGDHDYTDDEASNVDHLATLGALKLTKRVDSLIIQILQ